MANHLCFKQHTLGGTLCPEDIESITKEEWDQYCTRAVNSSHGLVTSNVTSGISGSVNNELQNFTKSIKCDITQYAPIKDDCDFNTWQQSFLALASTHKIEEVFDPGYAPSTPEGHQLFTEKQKFAYTILDSVLLTDMGKTLVQKYQKTFDAQKIWSEFVADATASTKAQIMSSEILSWITSVKYDNNFHGTASTFVMYWLNKVQEYDSYIKNDADHFSDVTKLTMLQNTVHDIPELRSVKTNAELEASKRWLVANISAVHSITFISSK